MIFFVSTNGDDTSDGSFSSPWKTPSVAVGRLCPGDILYMRGGEYIVSEAVVINSKGTDEHPIVISGYRDEEPVINGINVNFYSEAEKYPFRHETGIFFIHEAGHITLRKIKIINSHGHGIAARDSADITIDGCVTENTFACGISLWDTKSTASLCHHNKVIDNTVIKATTWDMLPDGMKRGNEPPHEAISIAGACFFEVCFNHVHHCDKEGIDVKENSHHGTVHHNHVHHVDRQGLYADAWFGPLNNVDFYENLVHDCKGAGIVVSVEQGHNVSDIRIYGNTVRDNHGSGILFGTWGADGPRMRIEIRDNLVEYNGHGTPDEGYDYYWITGGLCMLSSNISDSVIRDNIFIDNKGFDIGYSDRYIKDGEAIEAVLAQKNIRIHDNLIFPGEATKAITYPITTSFQDSVLYGYE